jgi:hypothetical protein
VSAAGDLMRFLIPIPVERKAAGLQHHLELDLALEHKLVFRGLRRVK